MHSFRNQQSEIMDFNQRTETALQNLSDTLKKVLHEDRLCPALQEDRQADGSTENPSRSGVERLANTVDDTVLARKFLRSLDNGEQLQRRYYNVRKTHKGTDEWALDDASDTGLFTWLRESAGLYWIRGKPGSGKSTLMKYLRQSPKVTDALREWGSSSTLVVASHFFWISGEKSQKSIDGLYRSLLYQIVQNHPELIADAVGSMPIPLTWDTERLWRIFEALIEFSEKRSDYRFCFFVDGLDEYEPAPDEERGLLLLVDAVNALSDGGNCNIKLCVSSRPWPVFENSFKNAQRLIMENHTLADMEKFAWERLGSSLPRSVTAKSEQVKAWKLLSHDIAEKAQGVWLWTTLVVERLRRRAAKNELGIVAARAAVDDFPSELEEFFRQTLERTEEEFRKDGSRLLLVVTVSDVQLTAYGLCQFIQDPEGCMNIETLRRPFVIRPDFQELRTLGTLEDRLKNRTMDLLEFEPCGLLQTSILRSVVEFRYVKIGFLHRSVKDFLKDHYFETLQATAGCDFDADLYALGLTEVGRMDRLEERIRACNAERKKVTVTEILEETIVFQHRLRNYALKRADGGCLPTLLMKETPPKVYDDASNLDWLFYLNVVMRDVKQVEILLHRLFSVLQEWQPINKLAIPVWHEYCPLFFHVFERMCLSPELQLQGVSNPAIVIRRDLLFSAMVGTQEAFQSQILAILACKICQTAYLSTVILLWAFQMSTRHSLNERWLISVVWLLIEMQADPNFELLPSGFTLWLGVLDMLGRFRVGFDRSLTVKFSLEGVRCGSISWRNAIVLLLRFGAEPSTAWAEGISRPGTAHSATESIVPDPYGYLGDIVGTETAKELVEEAEREGYFRRPPQPKKRETSAQLNERARCKDVGIAATVLHTETVSSDAGSAGEKNSLGVHRDGVGKSSGPHKAKKESWFIKTRRKFKSARS
ncbi:hypothetical protein BJ508DRAFT_103231 [Ascobolus immersus RN42]|uniref:Uncharacterized protein n=1 Tax=Ascobolus immersus RN42 TaxID=1160509 RepID=A0A3N4I7E6_ASCIM|nr:hypothetical protein BJ508DRAFT_103231 [Ascobolus immersus RN42]